MSTKAEDYKAEEMHRRHGRRLPSKTATARRVAPKPHNLSKHAARKAAVRFEGFDAEPSRKSTRRSRNRARPANPVERTEKMKRTAPKARAERAGAKSKSVRGKARGTA